ncbi:MAG: hypothetical protein JWQ34_893 [Mucilaginibacter sp.]|nr:hypothetical protein [Mucilaginibacter sp.]
MDLNESNAEYAARGLWRAGQPDAWQLPELFDGHEAVVPAMWRRLTGAGGGISR